MKLWLLEMLDDAGSKAKYLKVSKYRHLKDARLLIHKLNTSHNITFRITRITEK